MLKKNLKTYAMKSKLILRKKIYFICLVIGIFIFCVLYAKQSTKNELASLFDESIEENSFEIIVTRKRMPFFREAEEFSEDEKKLLKSWSIKGFNNLNREHKNYSTANSVMLLGEKIYIRFGKYYVFIEEKGEHTKKRQFKRKIRSSDKKLKEFLLKKSSSYKPRYSIPL